MIMSGTLSNISQRLHEVNMLLSTCEQGAFSFAQALLLSLFYRDFSETNTVVEEAESLAEKDADQLLKFSSSLFRRVEHTCPLTGSHCRLWTLKPFLKNT